MKCKSLIIGAMFFSLPMMYNGAQGKVRTSEPYPGELMVFHSENLHCDDSVMVVSPGKRCGRKNLPTLFLLHGHGGCWRSWSRKCDLQAVADRFGFRIVCPDGFHSSWYVNSVKAGEMQWRSFFDEELYPAIKEKYGLDPEKTFISGLSMGGHGALNVFFDDPGRFKAAGSMSGVLDLRSTKLKTTDEKLGDRESSPAYDAASAVNRVKNIAGTGKQIIISCGYDDHLAADAYAMDEKCKKEKIPHFLLISPGVHSWNIWNFYLPIHLSLFTTIMQGGNLGY